jgi:hypothetical protein
VIRLGCLLAGAVLSAAPPNVIALPPKQPVGLDLDAGVLAPLPDRPLRFPFQRVVFATRDSIVADDYLCTLKKLPGGGLQGDIRFASGELPDRFLLEVSPRALKEARALLTVQQGNDHTREEPTRLKPGAGYMRNLRVEGTSFPFLPSQRLVAEALTGRIGPLAVGAEERLAGLVRDGTRQFKLTLRKKATTVAAERYVLADGSGDAELLLVRNLPGIGEVDLIVSVTTYSHETVVKSLD